MIDADADSTAANTTASKLTIQSNRVRLQSSSKATLKFASPVNARVIEENLGDKYYKTVWCAILLGLTHVFSGAVIMTILTYSLHCKDCHPVWFAAAYHFFSAQAIMTLSYINGWSTPMRFKHRKFVHIFLQLCGVTCSAIGTAIIVVSRGQSRTVHGLSGLITLLLTLLAVAIGPFALKGKNKANVLHMMFGIPCFLMSSLCLCSGVVTSEFKKWAGLTIVDIVLAFTVFYTVIIVSTTFMKLMQKM